MTLGVRGVPAILDDQMLEAFVAADEAMQAVEQICAEMQLAQQGKWRGYFDGDRQSNFPATHRALQLLRDTARVNAEAP